MGSSRSSSVAPHSSSSRIWKRACWPPEATRRPARRRAPARSGQHPRRLLAAHARAALAGRRPSPRCSTSSSVRPRSSGCSWVCTNHPGRTRAPSLALPVCGTGAGGSPTGGARRRGRCRRRPAAAGSATCRSRWSPGPPPARRTRPRGRRAASGRSARVRLARRPPTRAIHGSRACATSRARVVASCSLRTSSRAARTTRTTTRSTCLRIRSCAAATRSSCRRLASCSPARRLKARDPARRDRHRPHR